MEKKKRKVICPSPPSPHKSYSKISFASLGPKEDLCKYESSIAGGVIHKTIAMLHRVTTQVRDKDKYHWKHSVLNNIK